MISRRRLLFSATAAPWVARAAALTSKERVDRALAGSDTDRPPFTFWYHFGLEKFPGERHAKATLEFHRKFGTDLVKVMSDFPYPKPAGKWFEVRVSANPFPEQIRALEMIRGGLGGKAHFVETIFNPWNQATKLSSADEVKRLMQEKPQALLDALEAIGKSEASHARRAIAAGASGIFLAIDNAQEGILTPEEYRKFSEPFDRMVLDSVRQAPLNTLHLHGDKVRLGGFWKGWPAVVINYSIHGTGVPFTAARKNFNGVLMGGIDERNFRKLSPAEARRQLADARAAAGNKYIAAGGCSVPNETTDQEMLAVIASWK